MTRRRITFTIDAHHPDTSDTIRILERALPDLAEIAAELADDFGPYIATMDELIANADATEGERISTPETGNPTLAAVLARARDNARLADVLGHLVEGNNHLRAARNAMARQARTARGVELAEVYKRHRCGEQIPATDRTAPWYHADCERIAVKAGLCSACHMRRWRYETADMAHA